MSQPAARLLKNNCSIAVEKHSLFEYQFNCSREHDFFHIATGLHHRRGGVSMIYRDHTLRDDRPGIEIIGNDMRRRADDL
jgi:hypothetical protein